jgi:hypothetical protein
MLRNILECRMPLSDDGRPPRNVMINSCLVFSRDVMDAVVLPLSKLIESGVPDDEAVERAFVMADKVLQGMLDRGWAVMAPTLDERYDSRRTGFVDPAE